MLEQSVGTQGVLLAREGSNWLTDEIIREYNRRNGRWELGGTKR